MPPTHATPGPTGVDPTLWGLPPEAPWGGPQGVQLHPQPPHPTPQLLHRCQAQATAAMGASGPPERQHPEADPKQTPS